MLQTSKFFFFVAKLLSVFVRDPAVGVNREIIHLVINDLCTADTEVEWNGDKVVSQIGGDDFFISKGGTSPLSTLKTESQGRI